MEKKLSFSAYKRFMTCPKYYQYHDIDKDRPPGTTSALLFGTYIDNVIELRLKNSEIIPEFSLPASERVTFYPDDLDLDLIEDEILNVLETDARSLGWSGDSITDALKGFISDQENLSDNQYFILQFAITQILRTKARAMISSFEKWILPDIKEIHSCQQKVENLSFTGIADLIVTLQDGRKAILDIKTSSAPYAKNSARYSAQLALYAHLAECDAVGFVVLNKTISKNKVKTCATCNHSETGGSRKNCPKCKTAMSYTVNPSSYSQLIVENISDEIRNLTKDALNDTIKCIENGVFPRNLTACTKMYGKPCPYIKKCWQTEDK